MQDHNLAFDEWWLLELREDGTTRRGLEGPGYSAGFVRVR